MPFSLKVRFRSPFVSAKPGFGRARRFIKRLGLETPHALSLWSILRRPDPPRLSSRVVKRTKAREIQGYRFIGLGEMVVTLISFNFRTPRKNNRNAGMGQMGRGDVPGQWISDSLRAQNRVCL